MPCKRLKTGSAGAGELANPFPTDFAVTNLEMKTRRIITIETRMTDENLAKCHPQEQSPLFRLAAELRNYIFELATGQTEDPRCEYKYTDLFYRPGHHARLRTFTSLLSTCRLAWLETNHLPMLQSEQCFWFGDPERRPQKLQPHDLSEEDRFKWLSEWLSVRLTYRNGCCIEHIHVFGQVHWLEQHKLNDLVLSQIPLPCRTLTLTVGHADWEKRNPISLGNTTWLKGLLCEDTELDRVREFRLELETEETRVGQLRNFLAELREQFSGRIENRHSEATGPLILQSSQQEMTWSGFRESDGKVDAPVRYTVITLTWKRPELETVKRDSTNRPSFVWEKFPESMAKRWERRAIAESYRQRSHGSLLKFVDGRSGQ